MRKELVTDALNMAVARRRPGEGLLHHSDRGSQYTAVTFGKRCRDAGITLSMGSKGDCYDNSVIESFWASLKKELGLTTGRRFATRAEARAAIFEYIETFYNPRRRHSTLGYRSPVQHEQHHAARALTPVG